jgi:hypothetical protein
LRSNESEIGDMGHILRLIVRMSISMELRLRLRIVGKFEINSEMRLRVEAIFEIK